MYRKILFSFVFMAIMLLSISSWSGDSKYSIPIYKHMFMGRTRTDSILIGRVSFDQLPEYLVESRVEIECYSTIDTERGIKFGYSDGYNPYLELSSYNEIITGPIKKGETVRCEFTIKPLKVGFIPLSFIIGETPPVDRDDILFTKIIGSVNLNFILGPDGLTKHIADENVEGWNYTRLGPNPDLLSKGVQFAFDPKVDPEIKVGREDIIVKPWTHIFSVDTDIQLSLDTLIITSRVSPYHQFEAGIAYMISHSSNFSVLEMSPSLAKPVDTGSIYEFTSKILIQKSGYGGLTLSFYTPNPDRYDNDGVFASLKATKLSAGHQLFIGIDKNKDVFFITEEYPWNHLDDLRQQGDKDPSLIDLRYSKIEGKSFDWSRNQEYGEGEWEIMRFWYNKWKESGN